MVSSIYQQARFTFEHTLAGDYFPSYTTTTMNLDNRLTNMANLGSTILEFLLHVVILYLLFS